MTRIEIADRNKQIAQMAKDGKTADFIAEAFKMQKIRVQSILKSLRIKPGTISHALECENAQNIIKELKAGTKQSDIARKYNISRQYVSQIKFKWEASKKIVAKTTQ